MEALYSRHQNPFKYGIVSIARKQKDVKKMYPRHTPQVLLALKAPSTFNELERVTKIPPSTLSRSLKILLKSHTIMTRPLKEEEERTTSGMWKYELTNKGKQLVKIAESLEQTHKQFWEGIEEL